MDGGDQISWRPVLAFDSDDREFTRGYQLGLLMGLLQARAEGIERPDQVYVYGESAEMLQRIRDALPMLRFEIEDLGTISPADDLSPEGHISVCDDATLDAGSDWLLCSMPPAS